MAPTACSEGQPIAPHPIDHHGDGMLGLADRTQLRGQLLSLARYRQEIRIVLVRRPQELYVARRKFGNGGNGVAATSASGGTISSSAVAAEGASEGRNSSTRSGCSMGI